MQTEDAPMHRIRSRILLLGITLRYLCLGGILAVLWIFHEKLPLPWPSLAIFCALSLIPLAILHLLALSAKTAPIARESIRWFDAALAPYVFYASGGFLSPLVTVFGVSALTGGMLYRNRRNPGLYVFIFTILSYVLIALLQKYGILANPLAWSATLMSNDPFFYLVLGSVVAGYFIGYWLLESSMNWRLAEMADAYRGVSQSCFTASGEHFFERLVEHLAIASGAARVEAGWVDAACSSFHAEAVREENAPGAVFVRRIEEEFFRTAAGGSAAEFLSKGPWRWRAGVAFAGSGGMHRGILCLYFKRPPDHTGHTLQLLRLFAAGAGAEAERRDMDTEREKIQEQALYTQKMKAVGQLAGGIAHGFNNLLNTIIGYAELIERRLCDDPQLSRYAAGIKTSSRKAADLTAQLLTFARKGKYQVNRVDLHEVSNAVALMIAHSLDKKIVIRKVLDAREPYVLGDRAQLENALLSMAMNARDAMPDGGELMFSTATLSLAEDRPGQGNRSYVIPRGDYVVLKVKDSGRGMDEETKQHLFEPFFTTKDVGQGTGLGLAAVFGCVKNHNGWIEVDSAQGLGTVFTIYLPLHHQEETPFSDSGIYTISKEIKPLRILFVDDDETVLETTVEALTEVGFEVKAFHRADDALRYFHIEHAHIDLALLDIIMPGMDGNRLFEELRTIAPGLPAVFVSGYSPDSDTGEIVRDPGVRHVSKPYTMKNIVHAIRELLPSSGI